MPTYEVNATLHVPAWLVIDADSPDEALAEAEKSDTSNYEYDMGSATVEFNVEPAVTER